METLPNGLTMVLPEGTFPLSTDSMLLAHFVRLCKNARVLDLGSGCGTLGLLLCAKDDTCTVTGMEISPVSHLAALDNIQRNNLDHRLKSVQSDLRELPPDFTGYFHCCVSNPPYFSGGLPSTATPLARQDLCCTTQELCRTATNMLKFGGDFYVVHKPENLAHLIACAGDAGMEAKRLLLLRHRPEKPVSLIALQLRKGGKPGLILEEATLFHSDGTPTPYYRHVYHMDPC